MPANVQPLFELVPHAEGFQFVNATSTTKETICTPGTNGTRIDSISICSNDTSAQDIAFYINDGTTDRYIGNVHVAIGSGYTTVVKVEGLTTLMPAGVPYLKLKSGNVLKANMVAAVTTAKAIDVVVIGGDY